MLESAVFRLFEHTKRASDSVCKTKIHMPVFAELSATVGSGFVIRLSSQ